MVSPLPQPDPGPPQNLTDVLARERLQQALESYGEQALPVIDETRAQRDAPAPASPGSTVLVPDQVDALLKEGTEEERQAFALQYGENQSGAYPREPKNLADVLAGHYSGYQPDIDDALQSFAAELPDVKSQSLFGAVTGQLKDIGGNVIGTALDALSWPADRLEQAAGLVVFSDLPMNQRWALGSMTYDALGTGTVSEVTAAYVMGDSLDDIEDQYGDAKFDALGKIVLDPLWLIGGVPFVSALGAPRIISRGLPVGRAPLLRKVPLLRNLGVNQTDIIAESRLAYLQGPGRLRSVADYNNSTFLRKAFLQTPRALADEGFSVTRDVYTGTRNPAIWADNGAQLRDLARAARTGAPTPSGLFSPNVRGPIADVGRVSEGTATGASIENLRSFGAMDDHDIWKGAREFFSDDTLQVLETRGWGALTPPQQIRYGMYRNQVLSKELDDVIRGVHYKEVMGAANPDLWQKMDSISSGMKKWLSYSLLNTPRFVVLNYLSNTFHLAVKSESPRATARFIRHPFGAMSRTDETMLGRALGITADTLNQAADEGMYARDFLGHGMGVEGPINPLKKRPFWKAATTYFIDQASKVDHGMRRNGLEQGMSKGAHASWKLTTEAGGVIPPPPTGLDDVPEVLARVRGLVKANGDDLDTLVHDVTGTDGLVHSGSLAYEFATDMAQRNLVEGSDLSLTTPLWRETIDENKIDAVQDIIEAMRGARRAGVGTWMDDGLRQFDELADDVDLEVFGKLLDDGLQPPSLPMTNIRNVTVPWQDIAVQRLYNQEFTQLMARTLSRSARGPRAGVTMQRVLGTQTEYQRALTNLQMGLRHTAADPATYRTYVDDVQRLMQERSTTVRGLLAEGGLPGQEDILNILRRDEGAMVRDLVERLDKVGTDEFASAVRRAHVAQRGTLEEGFRAMGLDWNSARAIPEAPTVGQASGASGDHAQQFIRFAREQVPARFRDSRALTPEQLTAFQNWVPELKLAINDRQLVQNITGRAFRDFVALNYSQKYGIDGALSLVFPYHFWIGRTMNHWMRLSLSRPGATSSYLDFYKMVADINEEAGLPDRLKNSIRIPVPFLDQAISAMNTAAGGLVGGAGTQAFATGNGILFDPLRVMFPLASFQNDVDFNSGVERTTFGKLYDGSQQFSSANPLITGLLGASGFLGDRESYVRRALNVPALPFGVPGPRIVRAASDYFSGISDDPDPAVLTREMKERLAAGEPLTELELKDALKEVLDFSSTDSFDSYRVDRTIASMVGADPERWTPQAGLEALKFRQGELFREAEKQARTERGLSIVTGWLFMPLRLYPEGEEVQRGLDAIWRETRDLQDPEATDAFFAQHPEYSVRRINLLDREDGSQQRELDTALFFIDLEEIQRVFEPEIEQLEDIKRRAEEAEYLKTKEGKRLLAIIDGDIDLLSRQQEDEVDRLEALYPSRSNELSLRASPRERALYGLRSEYFDIKRSDFSNGNEWRAARAAFAAALPLDSSGGERWMQMAVKSVATWAAFSDRAAQTLDREDAIAVRERRDEELRGLTAQARKLVTQDDFDAYLGGSGKAPTPQRIEYSKASAEISQYFAIDESALSPDAKKSLKRAFWNSHPLLETYFGNTEPEPWSLESALAFGAMSGIWDGYFDFDDNPQAQKDYLAGKLRELNELRLSVGLAPIGLVDFTPVRAGLFQQPPTDAHEEALQRELATQDVEE